MLVDPLTPGLFEATEYDDCKYVVMPMRV